MDLTKCIWSLASLWIVLAYTFKNQNGFLTSYDVYIQKLDKEIIPYGTGLRILTKNMASCDAYLAILAKEITLLATGL